MTTPTASPARAGKPIVVWAIAAAIPLMLLVPAVGNGYPLLQSDTGGEPKLVAVSQAMQALPKSSQLREHYEHEDDRDPLKPRVLSNQCRELKPIEVRHADIHQDDRDLRLQQVLQRLRAALATGRRGASPRARARFRRFRRAWTPSIRTRARSSAARRRLASTCCVA